MVEIARSLGRRVLCHFSVLALHWKSVSPCCLPVCFPVSKQWRLWVRILDPLADGANATFTLTTTLDLSVEASLCSKMGV